MVTILMMSTKLASPALHDLKIIQKKIYDVIILDYDVTNEILPGCSNLMVDVDMWPKFGNYSFSMREVIITSIL